jgi:hypothetical protein
VPTLAEILRLPESPRRTAALAAWFQSLYPTPAQRPVLIGGAAVELYTAGAYCTGDLDFAGTVPPAVARFLGGCGFRRSGRHWVHEQGEVFLELPVASLLPREQAIELAAFDRPVLVVSPEDLLVDRLAAWQHWRSPQDGANAFLLWRALRRRVARERLWCRAAEAGTEPALARLIAFGEQHGRCDPPSEALARWAREVP